MLCTVLNVLACTWLNVQLKLVIGLLDNNNNYYYYYYRIVRNKAADTARLSNRGAQQTELGLMLPATSTTRPSGQTAGITLTEDEQAAANLYAIGNLGNLLQGNAGAMSPLTAQQQAAAYAAGGAGNVAFNSPTSLVNRRTPASDDGKCTLHTIATIISSLLGFQVFNAIQV